MLVPRERPLRKTHSSPEDLPQGHKATQEMDNRQDSKVYSPALGKFTSLTLVASFSQLWITDILLCKLCQPTTRCSAAAEGEVPLLGAQHLLTRKQFAAIHPQYEMYLMQLII